MAIQRGELQTEALMLGRAGEKVKPEAGYGYCLTLMTRSPENFTKMVFAGGSP